MSEEAYQHLDSLAKPIGALGLLEDWAARLRHLQHPSPPSVTNPSLAIFCADHGVAHAKNDKNLAVVAAAPGLPLSRTVSVSTLLTDVVDVGIIWPSSCENPSGEPSSTVLPGPPIRAGTGDITDGPAMSMEECAAAEAVGARIVAELRDCGSNCIALGEAEIGNTTASAALLSAYTGQPAYKTCGAGSGVDAAGREHKIGVVERALTRHRAVVKLGTEAARGVVAALGGIEIAAIVGALLEAERRGVAAIVDGFICSVAALAAVRIKPSSARCMFLATVSPETGHRICVQAIAKYIWRRAGRPRYGPSSVPLDMGLRLGEGTGALFALPIVRAAADVYNKVVRLSDAVEGSM